MVTDMNVKEKMQKHGKSVSHIKVMENTSLLVTHIRIKMKLSI